MGYIYKIVNNVNNKVYIGQTTYTLDRRWQQHLSKSKTNNSLLYKEMRRIGQNHFRIDIIEECSDNILDKREMYYIDKFNSYYNGYNSTLGGHGGAKYNLDDDKIIKMYETYGINYIAEYFNCNKIVIKSILIKNKVELREYINESIKVTMLSKDYSVITNFNSKKDAWRWLVKNYRNSMKDSEAYTRIKRACKYGDTAFGYKWMYTDDIDLSEESISYNIRIQKMNKLNRDKEDKKEASLSIRDEEKNSNRNSSGRHGIKCELDINGNKYQFNKLYECIEFISRLEGEYIQSSKILRSRACNLRKALDKGLKYKGYDIRILE